MPIADLCSRAFLAAAESAVDLLSEPNVGARWTQPSALADFSVGGLAAHLARAVLNTREVLIAPAAQAPPITVFEHYRRSAWNGSDPESAANQGIRQTGERAASDGPGSVLAQVRRALDVVRTELADPRTGRPVFLPWAGWSLTRDDFLLTRMVELVVHADDLAVSIGIPAVVPPDEPLQLVIDLLARLAMYEHGPLAVLRTLSRAKRAPKSISAL